MASPLGLVGTIVLFVWTKLLYWDANTLTSAIASKYGKIHSPNSAKTLLSASNLLKDAMSSFNASLDQTWPRLNPIGIPTALTETSLCCRPHGRDQHRLRGQVFEPPRRRFLSEIYGLRCVLLLPAQPFQLLVAFDCSTLKDVRHVASGTKLGSLWGRTFQCWDFGFKQRSGQYVRRSYRRNFSQKPGFL